MKFEIKSRWTGSVIFTAEIEATDETPLGIKLGLAVKKAVEVNANLDGASLDGANLDGANLWIAAGNNRHVRTIQAGEYLVSYTNDIMQIGCQRHAIADWWEFDDRRIAEMDGKTALSFWKVWKPLLQQIIAAAPAEPTGYVAPEKQPEAAE